MLFSCLCSVCAWGTIVLPYRRERSPELTATATATSSTSTSLSSAVSTTDDDSGGVGDQDAAAQEESTIQLQRFFNSLDQTKQQALSNDNSLKTIQARINLAEVLKNFGDNDSASGKEAVQKLLAGTSVTKMTENVEVRTRAVLDDLAKKLAAASSAGETAKANEFGAQYEQFNQRLTDWVTQCVMDINNK